MQLMCCGILKYCLRGVLGDTQRQSLFLLLDSLRKVLKESHNPAELEDIEKDLNYSLALMERDFPMAIQVP